MCTLGQNLNTAVAAFFLAALFCAPVQAAEEARLDQLFAELGKAEQAEARRIAAEIELEWTRSGSAAMDLLLKRGLDALEAGDSDAAIGYLSALTDHAPDFAEAYYTRAIAYSYSELYGPAIEDLERTLILRPRHFNAMIGMGEVLEALGMTDLAFEAYSKAAAIHPHHELVSEGLKRVDPAQAGSEL